MSELPDKIKRLGKYALWTSLVWIAASLVITFFDRPRILIIGPPRPTPFDRSRIPPEMANIPNIEIEEYDVEGRTPKEIVDSLWARSIHVAGQGEAAAVTHSDIKFKWGTVTTSGRCRAINPVAQIRFHVTLPRHNTPGTPPDMQVRWNAFRRAVEMHEAEHVHIALDYAARIRAAIATSSCDDADRTIDRLEADMDRANLALDNRGCTAFRHGDGSRAALIECPHVLLYDLFGWR